MRVNIPGCFLTGKLCLNSPCFLSEYGDKGCAMDEFMCKGLRCYSHASRCDGSSNCYYGHDEHECGTSKHICLKTEFCDVIF